MLPKLSLRGAQRRGNPFPKQCECIAPAARPVIGPGQHCAPAGARKPRGLQGERIATPACALVRNDRLGSAVGLIESARVPAGAREGHDPPLQTHHQSCPLAFVTLGNTPALHCAFQFVLPCVGGALSVKYDSAPNQHRSLRRGRRAKRKTKEGVSQNVRSRFEAPREAPL